jgi:hypothetical protein
MNIEPGFEKTSPLAKNANLDELVKNRGRERSSVQDRSRWYRAHHSAAAYRLFSDQPCLGPPLDHATDGAISGLAIGCIAAR